jgi:hypothetical protein
MAICIADVQRSAKGTTPLTTVSNSHVELLADQFVYRNYRQSGRWNS